MCDAVCYPLQSYLSLLGVETECVELDFGLTNHFVLRLRNGTIIDPTASQFHGMPNVYIGPMPEIYKEWQEDFASIGRATARGKARRKVNRPLAIDLFCGLGGWTEGLLAEGYRVIGFDIEAHDYGDGKRYPAQLVIQDVLTIHGAQFKDAALIVASPPCQEFSYMAMPWSRAKAIAAEYRSGKRDVKKLTALFDACFRIQREAIEAAGHFIPMVVENVRGAQPWVGKARGNFGSYYLWGDVPALMPITMKRKTDHSWPVEGFKSQGIKDKDSDGYTRIHPNAFGWKAPRTTSKSNARKAASAQIARIPFPLARWIAHVWKPRDDTRRRGRAGEIER